MANATMSITGRRNSMTATPRYQALFLGAGAAMQCGVGQFTRRLGVALLDGVEDASDVIHDLR